jgi:hypothetical protein
MSRPAAAVTAMPALVAQHRRPHDFSGAGRAVLALEHSEPGAMTELVEVLIRRIVRS